MIHRLVSTPHRKKIESSALKPFPEDKAQMGLVLLSLFFERRLNHMIMYDSETITLSF